MTRIHKGRTNDKKQNDTILKTETNVTKYLEKNKSIHDSRASARNSYL